MTTSKPTQGGSFAFDKGKLTFAKFKDKHYVDEAVEHVKVAFPDQYGRLWATQVHADFFIKTIEADGHFEFQGNPFTRDVVGKSIEGLEEMGKNLKLATDLSTLRISHLNAKSAFVLADVCCSEDLKPLPHAPRTILKKQIESRGDI